MSTTESESFWTSRIRPWLRGNWAPLVLVFVAVVYAGLVVMMHTKALSPIDEWVYSDYLDKVPTQIVVKQGELVGHEALDRIACDGVFPYGTMGATCGTSYSDVSRFPFGGHTSADAYTPVYFVTTWAGGDLIRLVTGVSEITSWRLTGVLWLAATLVALVALFRAYKVPELVIAGLGLAFVVSPFSWWTYTFVSTDAPSMFFGALLMWLATRRIRGQGGTWWLLGLSALAVAFKVTNILAVGLVGLFFVTTWLWQALSPRERKTWPERLRALRVSPGLAVTAVAAVVVGAVIEVVWLAIRRAIAIAPQAGLVENQGLSREALAAQFTNFLPYTLTSNVVVPGGNGLGAMPIYNWAIAPLSWICVAGVLGAFWSTAVRGRHGALITTTAIASVTFAPILAVALTAAAGTYFELPPRYGAPILASMLLVVGLVLRNRFVAWLLVVYATGLGIEMLRITLFLSGG